MVELPRGTVTFLFTDIEGSTRLLKELGDRYGEVLADHGRILRGVWTRHGGREVDTQGDAFFVAFERATDALSAAVEAQRALMTHPWPPGGPVRVRIGIHTGEPAVGSDSYVGLGIHRAARISSVAHGGQILLSTATRELIADDLATDVALVDLGEFQLKDLERPERIYQLVVEGLPHQFPPLMAQKFAGGSPFVGREPEFAQLTASLEDALAGRGSLVLLGGEPGIGKSRLADEFAARARERGARVLWGRCWEAGGAPAYWPWTQSIRAYVQEVDADVARAEMGPGASDIAQMLPELRNLFPDLPHPASADPEGARFRLFDSTAAFLRSAASRRPLVLVLDDLHAADTPSLLMLQFVAGELARARMLLIGTYRDVELGRDHPLRATLVEVARAPSTRTLPLRGLAQRDVTELIELTAGRAVSDGVAAAIQTETEGNPLFAGEVVRLLSAEGTLDEVGGGTGRRIALPETVREVIGRRLRRLSGECTRILTLASVLGRELALDALELLSELPSERLLDTLDEAMAEGVVGEVPGSLGRLRFSHALIGEVLYEELTPLRRIRLHRRAGEVLETLYREDPETHLSELAHHFFDAAPGGAVDKAIDYARRAAERAMTLTAYEEAARLNRMALELLELREPPDALLRCELLLRLGDGLGRAGETTASREAFIQAAEAARALRLRDQLARAALGYGGRFVWEAARGDAQLVPLLEEALSTLSQEDTPLRAKLLARLAGGPLRDEVDRTRRDELSREAIEIARRLGDPATLAYVLDGRHAAAWWPENLAERLEIATELVRVAIEAGDKERALQGHHYRWIALLELGDMPGVYAELEAKAAIAEELRQPAQQFYVAACRATLACFEGRFDEAERLTDETFRLGRRAERGMAVIYERIQLYLLRRETGRLVEIEEAVRRSVDEFPTYVVLRCLLAHLYTELAREAEARAVFESLAAAEFADLPRNDEWLFGIALLADVAGALGDERRSETLYELLLPYDGRIAVSAPDACIGAVARSLGVLASVLCRWDHAERHFDDALTMNTRTGGRPWVAQTQYDLARMLLARDAPGDRDRALELLTACVELARELGSDALRAKAGVLAPLGAA